MLYITDCEVIKWKFKDIDHILLGVNYDKDMVDWSNTAKNNHVFRGHLEIGTACDFVKSNYSDHLQNVIMCHLSSENSDSDSFIEKMKKVTYGTNVDVAAAGKSWNLKNPNECPFQKGAEMLKHLKFCHVIGGKYNFDCHLYLSGIAIENYKNIGCKVKILHD